VKRDCWYCRHSNTREGPLACDKKLEMDAQKCREFIDTRKESAVTYVNVELFGKRVAR